MIEAIVFDMDGLLIDSEIVWDRVRRDWVASLGKTWTEADHLAVMGVDTQTWADYMAERLGDGITPERARQEVLARVAASYREEVPFKPGALEAIDLATAHFPAGVASGSHRSLIDIVFEHPALRDRFDFVLAADEEGAGKPAPDVYLAAAKRLGFDPAHIVCLEDSGNGILAGVRAGMKVIAVPDPRFPPPPEILGQAALVLDSLHDFSLDVVQRLGGE